ncbi:uncharacterized protein LOC134539046 [Bacillus rossius redtenbacheri]|uniref:uncharacterized protein LOC134539046 n=1 Tax=Bacillus rossius redtenbacheri TaxID=93214 RepID=UPI002FDD1A15
MDQKDGQLKFCVDYQKLNYITKKDNYHLPRIADTLDTHSGTRWFSTLDPKSSYWQVELNPEDKENTAFTTCSGLFQFTVTILAYFSCAEAYTCTAAGRFAATSCHQYYLCVATSSGYTAYLYTCAGSSTFSSATKLCSTASTTCSSSSTTSTSTTTLASSTTTAYPCTAAGRFAATSCRQYYLCVSTSSGYTAYLYTCPGNSTFNSATELCSTASTTCSTSSTTSTSTTTLDSTSTTTTTAG